MASAVRLARQAGSECCSTSHSCTDPALRRWQLCSRITQALDGWSVRSRLVEAGGGFVVRRRRVDAYGDNAAAEPHVPRQLTVAEWTPATSADRPPDGGISDMAGGQHPQTRVEAMGGSPKAGR